MDPQLAWEIGETASALRRFYDRRARHLGVTRAQWRVIAVLARQPGSKQIELAERLDMEPITLSRLTDKAGPLHAQLVELAGEVSLDAFAGFERDEIDQARALLARIRTNLIRYGEATGDTKAVA